MYYSDYFVNPTKEQLQSAVDKMQIVVKECEKIRKQLQEELQRKQQKRSLRNRQKKQQRRRQLQEEPLKKK